MIDPERIAVLNDAPVRPGRYVLYWMQASQRTNFNHALEHAIARANELNLPPVVCFGLMDDYPEANERHYAFMFQGLAEVADALRERGIGFVVRQGNPPAVALRLARDAGIVVCDRGYLRHQKRWRDETADGARCRVEQVESDVVVPVESASDKAEFAARTLRPKIHRLLDRFLKPVRKVTPAHPSLPLELPSDIDVTDAPAALARLKLDRSIAPTRRFMGGQAIAHHIMRDFVRHKLDGYAINRREPAGGGTSMLASYLHFGQISPVEIALAVRGADAPEKDRGAFLEELIVRRELAINFVHYTPDYDTYAAVPRWARQTLGGHRTDKRPAVYARDQLERAQTHDELWNAAQREMTLTGFMHNSMRMYWGKKILEWRRSPADAFADTLYLNNKYFLCGRDPVSYANVAWVFGLHDRPWKSRPIFGTVRYMNAGGLRRKFDMPTYLTFVDALEREAIG